MIKKIIVKKYIVSPFSVARFDGDCNSLKVFDGGILYGLWRG